MKDKAVVITPEAFGTLMAMKRLQKVRMVDPEVAAELQHFGLAERAGKDLVVTRRGRAVRKRARDARDAARG